MSTATTIAFGRNTKVFAKKETTPGTLVIPATGDMIVVNSGEIQVPNPTFVDDKGVRGSRSDFNRYTANIPGAPFKLQRYVRPSGATGTAPEADCVYESAHGLKTVVGGTSVTYSPLDTQPSFSLYIKKDHTVYVAAGCVIDKYVLKKDNKDLLEVSDDGKGFNVLWTGTGSFGIAIGTTPAPGTQEEWLVDDTKKWCVGSHIICDTEQMQVVGTDWQSSATATKIKVARGYNGSTVATHLINAVILPYLPTGTETGAPLAARVGTMTIAASSIPFLDIDFNYANAISQNEEEVTGTITPTDYFEGDRTVTGTMSIYFRKTDLKWFADAILQTRKAVVLNFGSIAGKMVQITLASCEFDMPTYAGDKDVMKLSVKYKAFAVSGNDEATVKFL